jgi:type II secretory pathway component PulF
MSGLLRYRGRRRDGTACTGAVDAGSPAELAEKLHRQGWRHLSISQGDDEIVGGIINGARRIWWGEQ